MKNTTQTTCMYQVLDIISGIIHAEYSNSNKAYDLWSRLTGAKVQMVQRPIGSEDSVRANELVEPYQDQDIPCLFDFDFDLDDDHGSVIEVDEVTKIQRPRSSSIPPASSEPFQRRSQWRDWVLASPRPPEASL